METFGQRFSRLRKEKGLKQEDIALKVSISPQAVSKWENDITSPDISILPMLADIFGVTVDELLGCKKVNEVNFVEEEKRKDINKMILKVNVDSKDGDKVRVNLPMAIIKICLESGLELPKINGKDTLSGIDFQQIFDLVEKGVIGRLVEVESSEGDTVYITVE